MGLLLSQLGLTYCWRSSPPGLDYLRVLCEFGPLTSGPHLVCHPCDTAIPSYVALLLLGVYTDYRLQITDWPHQSGAPERSQPRLHGQQ
jgi:hypothetical protein